MVKLKNGSTEPQASVVVFMVTLEVIAKTNPMAFYDLVQVCRGVKTVEEIDNKAILEQLALLARGKVNPTVKNIVLSGVTGEGLELALSDPY